MDDGNFFGFRFQESFVAVVFAGDRVIGQFFQHRVFDHFLIDHFPEFETIERQHAHHLDQTRRKDLLLGDPEVKFWLRASSWESVQTEMIAEVDSADFSIAAKVGRGPSGKNFAVLDDVGAVGNAQRLAHLVVGDQHADAFPAQIA